MIQKQIKIIYQKCQKILNKKKNKQHQISNHQILLIQKDNQKIIYQIFQKSQKILIDKSIILKMIYLIHQKFNNLSQKYSQDKFNSEQLFSSDINKINKDQFNYIDNSSPEFLINKSIKNFKKRKRKKCRDQQHCGRGQDRRNSLTACRCGCSFQQRRGCVATLRHRQ